MSNAKIKRSYLPNIPGTKPATSNAQLLVSTGIPSLDYFIGGGLPIGSILLLEEDAYNTYSKIMFKYFIAEGIVSHHSIFLSSQDVKPSKILSDLPAPIDTENSRVNDNIVESEEMKIAWRYKNIKISESKDVSTFGHYYDLTKPMESETLNKANVSQWDGENVKYHSDSFENQAYMDLLISIEKSIREGQFLVSQEVDKRNILRICISSLGSRLWLCDSDEQTYSDLTKFLYMLRTLLRESFTVAILTVPIYNYHDSSSGIIQRIEHLSDAVINLESFIGSTKETNPIFKDYHGLLHIKKIPAFNTLVSHDLLFRDLAFKLRRKKFLVEVLHLPPELGETTQREQDEIPTSSCGKVASGAGKLDF